MKFLSRDLPRKDQKDLQMLCTIADTTFNKFTVMEPLQFNSKFCFIIKIESSSEILISVTLSKLILDLLFIFFIKL